MLTNDEIIQIKIEERREVKAELVSRLKSALSAAEYLHNKKNTDRSEFYAFCGAIKAFLSIVEDHI